MTGSWRRQARIAGGVGLVVFLAPVIAAVMVITHEIGHTTVARLPGDGRATFVIYRSRAGDHCTGCNL
jgi:hypothetical protein